MTIIIVSQLVNISIAFYDTSISFLASWCSHIRIFISKIAKMAKDVLNKKFLDTSRLVVGTFVMDISSIGIFATGSCIMIFISGSNFYGWKNRNWY